MVCDEYHGAPWCVVSIAGGDDGVAKAQVHPWLRFNPAMHGLDVGKGTAEGFPRHLSQPLLARAFLCFTHCISVAA